MGSREHDWHAVGRRGADTSCTCFCAEVVGRASAHPCPPAPRSAGRRHGAWRAGPRGWPRRRGGGHRVGYKPGRDGQFASFARRRGARAGGVAERLGPDGWCIFPANRGPPTRARARRDRGELTAGPPGGRQHARRRRAPSAGRGPIEAVCGARGLRRVPRNHRLGRSARNRLGRSARNHLGRSPRSHPRRAALRRASAGEPEQLDLLLRHSGLGSLCGGVPRDPSDSISWISGATSRSAAGGWSGGVRLCTRATGLGPSTSTTARSGHR